MRYRLARLLEPLGDGVAAALPRDGFDRSAAAEAEGGVDDMKALEAKPTQKMTEDFPRFAVASGNSEILPGWPIESTVS